MTTYKALRFNAKQKARYLFSKWPIAGALNRLRRTCWADLVDWALHKRTGDRDYDYENSLRNSISGGERCRKYSTEHPDRTCYCGKFIDGCLRPKDAS
jgi:hypothetical protein